MKEDALAFAAHDTLIDFRVDAVAVATTDVGVASARGAADTETAEVVFEVEPLPSEPDWFRPQHLMVESVKTAQLWTYPAEIWLTLPTPSTAVGMNWLDEFPVPSWPHPPQPQHHGEPSDFTAHVVWLADDIPITPVKSAITTGVLLSTWVLTPT